MKIVWLLFTLILAAIPAGAREYTWADLESLVDQAPAVRAADSEAAARSLDQSQAGFDWMDTMIGYQVMDLSTQPLGLDPAMTTQKLTLQQTLPSSGKIFWRAGAAEAEKTAAAAGAGAVRLAVRSEVLGHWLAWQAGQQKLANLDENLGLLESLVKVGRMQYTNGLVSQSSLTDLEIQVVKTRTERLRLNGELQNHQAAILSSLEVQAGTFALKPVRRFLLANLPPADQRIESSPDYQMAWSEWAAAQAETGAAGSAFFPDLNLMAELTLKPSGAPSLALGVELPLPLFSAPGKALALTAQTRRSESSSWKFQAVQKQLAARLAQIRRNLETQAQVAALLQTETGRRSKENFTHMLAEFQVGKVDLNTVYQAISQSFDIDAEFLEAWENYHLSLAELETLLGKKIFSSKE